MQSMNTGKIILRPLNDDGTIRENVEPIELEGWTISKIVTKEEYKSYFLQDMISEYPENGYARYIASQPIKEATLLPIIWTDRENFKKDMPDYSEEFARVNSLIDEMLVTQLRDLFKGGD